MVLQLKPRTVRSCQDSTLQRTEYLISVSPFKESFYRFHIPELSEPRQAPWLADPEGCRFFPSPCFSFHGVIFHPTCFYSWFKDGCHRPGILGFLFSFGEMLRVSAPAFWSSLEISSDCIGAHPWTQAWSKPTRGYSWNERRDELILEKYGVWRERELPK